MIICKLTPSLVKSRATRSPLPFVVGLLFLSTRLKIKSLPVFLGGIKHSDTTHNPETERLKPHTLSQVDNKTSFSVMFVICNNSDERKNFYLMNSH